MFAILGTLLSGLFGKSATVLYPLKPKPADPLARGQVSIDMETCIFCSLCAKKCPTGAISVDKSEKTWSIGRFHCIQCNSCVESCPKKCLRMDNRRTPVSTTLTKDVVSYARVRTDTVDSPDG